MITGIAQTALLTSEAQMWGLKEYLPCALPGLETKHMMYLYSSPNCIRPHLHGTDSSKATVEDVDLYKNLHRQSLEGKVHELGWHHPSMLTSVDSLASVLHCQGKWAEFRAVILARWGVAGARRPWL